MNNEFYGPGCCAKSWCPSTNWTVVASIVNAPPSPLLPGVIYLVGTSPTGEFSTHANMFARYSYEARSWEFCAPFSGMRVTPENALSCSILQFGSNGWVQLCESGGVCLPVNISVNGVALAAALAGESRVIQVLQGGSPVGTVNPVTNIVTIPPCPASGTVETTINGVNMPSTPSGGTITILVTQGGNPVGAVNPGLWTVEIPECEPVELSVNGTDFPDVASGGSIALSVLYQGGPVGTVDTGTGVITIPDAFAQLRDSAANNLGAPVLTLPGATVNIPAPDAIAQLRDTLSALLSTTNIRSGQTLSITAPNGVVNTTDGLTLIGNVLSGGNYNVPQSRIFYKDVANADQVTALSNTVFISGALRPSLQIPRGQLTRNGAPTGVYISVAELISGAIPDVASPLKFGWGAGDADTLTWTVTADEAGTYGTYTQDGSSGAITYNKNSGGFVALSGSVTLAVADTIIVRRTVTTSQGFSKWAL
jgi:hypothetical protein